MLLSVIANKRSLLGVCVALGIAGCSESASPLGRSSVPTPGAGGSIPTHDASDASSKGDAVAPAPLCENAESACCCDGDQFEIPVCVDGVLTCPGEWGLYHGEDCRASVGPCAGAAVCSACFHVFGVYDEATVFDVDVGERGAGDGLVFDFEWRSRLEVFDVSTTVRASVHFLTVPPYAITEAEGSYPFPQDGGVPLEVPMATLSRPDLDGGQQSIWPVRGHFIVRRAADRFIGIFQMLYGADASAGAIASFDEQSPGAVSVTGYFSVLVPE